ncbi:hypothetical protein E2C01_095988 [Portunus trituberculatus]|uniref:Uncharacterized protein n=1 Tax=Portunus trituberculatus TaxID=210409 RepID=A0A5B7JRG6_PORTR|nr:hypothetical protein [Portunus trituberculatus]
MRDFFAHYSFLLLVCTAKEPRAASGWHQMFMLGSDLELNNDTIEETCDDDVLDPDFFLHLLDDDLAPIASSKQAQCIKTNVLEVPLWHFPNILS